MMIATAELQLFLPELFLAAGALVLLMYGAYAGERKMQVINAIGVLIFVVAALLVTQLPASRQSFFNHMLVHDSFAAFIKIIILAGSALALLMTHAFAKHNQVERPEYPVLIMLAALGMMVMVSAHDLLALYVGLELQSLCLYVLAAFQRERVKSAEAGLKYFVLGALSSGILLYGISLIYGGLGSTDYAVLSQVFSQDGQQPLSITFGLVFICAAMAFKVAAVPFHMWAPDVYEGAPTPVTAYFAAAPKIAALAMFARLLLEPMMGLINSWQQILFFTAISSMILGGFAALTQQNIKRLMAYSSIAHVGYALVGLATGTASGLQGVLVYLAIYFINTLGTFAVILCLRRQGQPVENLSDLAGLSKTHPMLALAMVICMLSLAGVPPLAGFFGKFYVFMAAVEVRLYWLALIGLLTSAVACYYYIRIVKLMYFDEPQSTIDPVPEVSIRVVMAITSAYLLLFCVFPQPVVNTALHAATGLLVN